MRKKKKKKIKDTVSTSESINATEPEEGHLRGCTLGDSE
jgi:hypothetical protein